jgi:Transglutaminase-like superfamily/Coenzyme PQQ synthesis protein D (PqqD)
MASTVSRFVVSTAVRSSSDKDGTTMLHITENKIYGLVGVGSVIWEKLLNSTNGLAHSEIVQQLRREFTTVPRRQIEQDVSRILDGFLKTRLVEELLDKQRSKPNCSNFTSAAILLVNAAIRSFLSLKMNVAAALFAFVVVDLLLKLAGFNVLYNTIKNWPIRPRCAESKDLTQIWQDVCSAITWYPKQPMCLQRSVVTTWLLRSRGIPAQVIIGCQKRPFLVHAWTEVNGQVVNDRQSVRDSHVIIDRW